MLLLIAAGCGDRPYPMRAPAPVLGAAPAGASAEPLGNLVTGRAPSKLGSDLALFFFGADAPAPPGLFKPVDIAATGDDLLICDAAWQTVFRWQPGRDGLDAAASNATPRLPSAIAATGDDGWLLADAGARVVLRMDAGGAVRAAYTRAGAFRPSGVAVVGEEVWISNAAAHCVEVFAGGGPHLRTIGRRGNGPGEFGFPLGMALVADGVAIVDMLNGRVQVLNRSGEWVRDIGGQGRSAGQFGRPRGVTVGPDGTVFVVDATSQRVHAFSAAGAPMATFGEGSPASPPLVLPGGISTARRAPRTANAPRDSREPSYYVLVAEQLLMPGVRVFAWHGPPTRTAASPTVRLAALGQVENPHWNSARCDACHGRDAGAPKAISVADADRLCLSCHDGTRAAAEAHPIGWPAQSAKSRAPEGWPLADGKLACLTCHALDDHCKQGAVPPARNRAFVRGFSASDAGANCRNCHHEQGARFNPHQAVAGSGVSASVSCGFCHQQTESVSANTEGRAGPLRTATSDLCLTCHVPHADPSPRGHLGARYVAPMTTGAVTDARPVASSTAGTTHTAVRMPTNDGRIECYTCHNPHPPQVAGAAAQLAARGADDRAQRLLLRTDSMQLCVECHPK